MARLEIVQNKIIIIQPNMQQQLIEITIEYMCINRQQTYSKATF